MSQHSKLHNFSAPQIEDLKEVFTLFDISRKQRMNCSDLRVALRVLGTDLSPAEVAAHSSRRSSSGVYFTFSEFVHVASDIVSRRAPNSKQKLLEDAFDIFDDSKSGTVTAKQLSRVVSRINSFALTATSSNKEEGDEDLITAHSAVMHVDDAEIVQLLKEIGAEENGLTKEDFVKLFLNSSSIL